MEKSKKLAIDDDDNYTYWNFVMVGIELDHAKKKTKYRK